MRTSRRKRPIEARNHLEALSHQVEKTFTENKEKVDAAVATELETAIAEAKTALSGSDVDAINTAFGNLQTASHKLAEVIYSQASAAQGGGEPAAAGEEEQASSASAGAEGSAAASDDNVIDAEYVDVEDEKKE